ncbi:MAG TPA: hypothetical protein VFJ78_09850 [Gaiellaceae bacterium]|nr:hypothetical protein [Gaiellaceae bacterium]
MDGTAELASSAAGPIAATQVAKVLKLVFGSIGLLAALAFIGVGAALTWALETQRDASGYFTTHAHHYQTSTYALSTESLNVSGITGALEAGLGKLRVTATSADAAKPLFIGIARTRDVDRYLAGTQHDELRDIEFDPFKIDYRRSGIAAPTALPAARDFWRARASGTGAQTISWPVEKGTWSAVVMNADGSRDVTVDAQLAARFTGAWWFVAAFLALGALSLGAGAAVVYSGVRTRAPQPTHTSSKGN